MLKIALTSGRIRDAVSGLLNKAGLELDFGPGGKSLRPRPRCGEQIEFAVVRSKDAATLLQQGTFDAAFLGADILAEVGAEAETKTLLDTGADRVKLVLAVRDVDRDETVRALNGEQSRPFKIATKYPNLVRAWLGTQPQLRNVEIVPVEGSVEVFAHIIEGAIVDVAASGDTLRLNGLTPVLTLQDSSTLFVANRRRFEIPTVRDALDFLAFSLRGVIEAGKRQTLSLNVALEKEKAVAAILETEAMRSVNRVPTASGSSVTLTIAVLAERKYAVLRAALAAGATDPVIQGIDFLG